MKPVNFKLKYRENLIFCLLTISAVILRLIYVIRIPYTVNQHDAGNFTSGHIGYICYLAEHNWKLPDFNPTTVWSFYHPPLHHSLAAVVVKCSLFFGADLSHAMENVQFLTAFYGFCTLLVSYKLLKKFALTGFSLFLPYALLCFHPSLILLSGSINNDGLCLLLTLITAYIGLLWYEKPSRKYICLLALSFAATVLTKMSGLLLTPAVAFLFLAGLFKERTNLKQLFKQFVLFGIICIPLSLSFSIRNLLLWHVNPFFTLDLGDYMYTGTDIAERIFRLHKEQLASPFVIYNVLPSDGLSVDRNIILYLLKTSLYGDKFFLASDSSLIWMAWGLHLVNLFLILCSFVCLMIEAVHMLVAAFKEKSLFPYIRECFLYILYGSSFGSYLMFCFKYPNSCSQDFRYMNLTLMIAMVFWGTFFKRTAERNSRGFKILKGSLLLLTALFILFTTILYSHCSIL